MTIAEFIPVYVFLTITIFALTYIVIHKIREKYIGLSKEPDFIELFIDNKRRELDSNIGGMSFRVYAGLVIIIPIIVTLLIWVLL